MAPPMPPVAPVTSAVLPVRSNIKRSSMPLGPLYLLRLARRFEHVDVLRRPDRGPGGTAGDALDETAQHLAGADLVELRYALRRHVSHAFAPPHRTGDLLDEAAGEFGRIGHGACRHIGDQR